MRRLLSLIKNLNKEIFLESDKEPICSKNASCVGSYSSPSPILTIIQSVLFSLLILILKKRTDSTDSNKLTNEVIIGQRFSEMKNFGQVYMTQLSAIQHGGHTSRSPQLCRSKQKNQTGFLNIFVSMQGAGAEEYFSFFSLFQLTDEEKAVLQECRINSVYFRGKRELILLLNQPYDFALLSSIETFFKCRVRNHSKGVSCKKTSVVHGGVKCKNKMFCHQLSRQVDWSLQLRGIGAEVITSASHPLSLHQTTLQPFN